ncbi:MAG TPA: OB-fold nucleic acid binding domain-containing protein, partial [Flavobacterium sp.]
MSNLLDTPIEFLKGVGSSRGELLKKELGIRTYGELLNFYPNRYIDRTRYYKINQLQSSNVEVQVIGKIVHIKTVEQKRGKRLVATFADETGEMELVWFQGLKWVAESLKLNAMVVAFGKCNSYNGLFTIPHPELELLGDHEKNLRSAMQPVYPSTETLANRGISNRLVSRMVQQLFIETQAKFTETLPSFVMEELQLIPKNAALFNIHFPKSAEALAKARARLKFEELFFIQ